MKRIVSSALMILVIVMLLPALAGANATPEAELLGLINAARKTAGLALITLDNALSTVVQNHATEMIETGYIGHVSRKTGTLASRLRVAQIEYDRAGENLAGDASVSHAFASWMESPAHKGNVLGDFTKVGVAVVRGGVYGLMIVAVFTK